MISIKSVAKREDLDYDIVGSLGHGGYGTVLEVERRSDKQRFALKIMYTQRRTRRSLMETLRKEIDIIQALQNKGHLHFIDVFDAYETPTEIGLFTWPVADRPNLAQCLEEYLSTTSERTKEDLRVIFYRAFGCLAKSLAWMHARRFRHKDIKPANILIHAGRVIYCDFGRSLDSRLADSSTSEGPARATWKYMAPEAKASQSRNSSSDIFSLGCVFSEMAWALTWDQNIETDSFSDWLHHTLKHLPKTLAHTKDYATSGETKYVRLELWLENIMDMTQNDPALRPSSQQVASSLCVYRDLCCSLCINENLTESSSASEEFMSEEDSDSLSHEDAESVSKEDADSASKGHADSASQEDEDSVSKEDAKSMSEEDADSEDTTENSNTPKDPMIKEDADLANKDVANPVSTEGPNSVGTDDADSGDTTGNSNELEDSLNKEDTKTTNKMRTQSAMNVRAS